MRSPRESVAGIYLLLRVALQERTCDWGGMLQAADQRWGWKRENQVGLTRIVWRMTGGLADIFGSLENWKMFDVAIYTSGAPTGPCDSLPSGIGTPGWWLGS